MAEHEQIIACPNCNTAGWRRELGAWRECPVCETRGFLVIDSKKTMDRPPLRKPSNIAALKSQHQ